VVMLRTCCYVMDAIKDTIFIALNPSELYVDFHELPFFLDSNIVST
jgi:hypothetical protein